MYIFSDMIMIYSIDYVIETTKQVLVTFFIFTIIFRLLFNHSNNTFVLQCDRHRIHNNNCCNQYL